ncbi:hypothetical protein PsorP6_007753 [Peronosclerospora sorghi]|uniref:Uncharacterized protein n=1 Tax=Peronosclerospora sorghi TaxID=230839 RepID=A0ACC0W8F9_9STRA|nr:hypothetical protein PsorP6_007753 [Peronosclerospora sorghi]
MRRANQKSDEDEHSIWRSAPAVPVAMPASTLSFNKRRSTSLGDLLPATSSPANALVCAFHKVSSQTHQKLAKIRSRSDFFTKKATGFNHGGWRLKVNNPITNKPLVSSHNKFQWDEHHTLQHAHTAFEYHGEDAGAASNYFHIVADGVSSPFGRHSLGTFDGEPASSSIIATEVVRCVRAALEEVTNHDSEQLDQATFEGAVVDAIKTARINCFQHRKSRLATTLVVSYFNRWTGRLLTFSLGDSKCVVVRRGELVYETLAVLREFNVPTNVNLHQQVMPQDYVVQTFALEEGDVCLTFSDGLGDNLYKDDITGALAAPELWESEGSGLQSVCDQLVKLSKMHPLNEDNECHLYPFATAAMLEYRERTLEEAKIAGDGPLDASGVDHMALSHELMKRHEGKQILDRHLLLRKSSRKHHYSLMQLRLMADMETKKPDDITLFMTRFV